MIYIVLIFLLMACAVNLVNVLGLFQQEHYQIKPFLKHVKKIYTKQISTYFLYAVCIFTLLHCIIEDWYFGLIIIVLVGGFLNFNKRLIVKLKTTKRVYRLLLLYTLGLVWYWWGLYFNVWVILYTLLTPLIVILITFILMPVEKRIQKYYLDKALKKLQASNGIVVGITGSFGKTSVKNFAYTLMKSQYWCMKSPHSYNTPMGLAKTINESKGLEEYYLLEMGARYPSDIAELAKLYRPKIGIITEIGAQHLSTLKDLKTVYQTKIAILESPCLEKIIVNYDNEYLREMKVKNSVKLISVGLNEKAMYQIKDVVLTLGKTCFSLYYLDEKIADFETKLLGYHNILNLGLSIVLAFEENVSLEYIKYQVATMENVLHRLSYQSFDNIEIIDDAFNANFKGFVNALEVLKMSDRFKILITPGLVDLGDLMKEYNQQLALKIINSCDKVCLIKNEASGYIKQMFDENKFQQYEIYSSFKEAYADIIRRYQETKVTILIENDLPDHFF